MTEVMLWGPPVVPSDALDPEFRSDMETWMKKCVNSGVKRIIGGDRTLILTEVARSNKIDVHPYVNFNSFRVMDPLEKVTVGHWIFYGQMLMLQKQERLWIGVVRFITIQR